MVDKAEKWVSSYLTVGRNVDWSDFILDLSVRFNDDIGCNVVEKINRLQQTDSIEGYIDEFQDLRSLMSQQNHMLPDSYFLDSFVGGLEPTVKPIVRAFKPKIVSEAVEYARYQEESLSVNQPNPYKNSFACHAVSHKPAFANTKPPILANPLNQTSSDSKRPYKYIPVDFRQEKIAKGLCYYCDQPYDRQHKCKFREPQLFTVEVGSYEGLVEDSDEDIGLEHTDLQLVFQYMHYLQNKTLVL